MNTISVTLVITLLGQSLAHAEEPVAQSAAPIVLSRAIAVEARRLASSEHPFLAGRQAAQPAGPVDTRPGCLRHGAACGAALGYLVGFLAGLMNPGDDFDEPMGFALVFTGPIGAGIGAAVGWGIAEGTKPAQKPRQP